MPLRILYLVPCWPSGPAFGTRLRVRQIGSALRTLGTLDAVVVRADDGGDRAAEREASFPVRRVIKLLPITSRSASERLRCGLDPMFVGYHGRYVDQRDRMSLLADLPNYDLVWIYELTTADVFGQWRWARSVLDVNDIPSAVLQTQLRNAESISGRVRAGLRIPVARCRERMAESRFTTLCVCSNADESYLRSRRAVHVIPNGFPGPEREPLRNPVDPPRIGFVGTFEYSPNVDGIRWFVKECWPLIKHARPDVRLRLMGIGSDDPTVVPVRDANIDALGWVDDAGAEIATWATMIVPLRIGGGTRVKIAEGFSRKCPIVSTCFGAYGYGAIDGREMFLSESARGFANACLRVITEPDEARVMAERAWEAFLEKWTWDALQPRVLAAADDCLRRESQHSHRRGAA
jgi:glycosyltransferase involved in cell wall biosynthesis